eukprot:scaffold48166_cov60-Phaeocystis_antarctica.AAC.1
MALTLTLALVLSQAITPRTYPGPDSGADPWRALPPTLILTLTATRTASATASPRRRRRGGGEVAPLGLQQPAEVPHAAERARMPIAEGLALPLQRLAQQRLSGGEVALVL